MKIISMIIFFTIFIGVYTLGNWYVYSRGMQALPTGFVKSIFPWVFWALASSFVLGQFLERLPFNYFSQIISYIGSFWLVLAWYALLMIIAIDLIRLANHFIGFIPEALSSTIFSGKILISTVSLISVSLVIAGAINAYIPRINNIDIDIDKPNPNEKNLKVALVSDIHMGFIIGNNRTNRLVNRLNEQNPDLILLAGDIVDHNPMPVIRKELGKHYKKLNPKYGIYAVTGNHEFIGSPEISVDYLSGYGINYLRDTAIELENGITIVGREDKEKPRFSGSTRKPLAKLLNNVDKSNPIILMDHQPIQYDRAEKEGVDLMVSGHTHKGQFWPFGYITKKVFELDYGFKKKGKTNFYVSSGYGTWGPPVRIGSKSEIVILNVSFNNN